MNLTITTWDNGNLFDMDKIKLVGIKIPWGNIEILPGHGAMIMELVAGVVRVKRKQDNFYFAIKDGLVTIDEKDGVCILTENSARPRDVKLAPLLEEAKTLEELIAKGETGLDDVLNWVKVKIELAELSHEEW